MCMNGLLKTVRDARHGELTRYESSLILIRPDQYVVWSGERPPNDVGALMGKVAGRL